jgi:uncharacterized protein
MMLSLVLAPLLLLPAPAALAASLATLPESPPAQRVLDTADVLSRAASGEISRQLDQLREQDVEAHLITVPRLDYGLGVDQLGAQLIERWQDASPSSQQLILLIDAQTGAAAVVATAELADRLGPDLLRSTGRSTLGQPLREGGRYRQASLDALSRLSTVLLGGEDPGEPQVPAEVEPIPTNVPSREETAASRAWVWVSVLLVVGSVVPMLTWWVFSR